MKKTLIAAGILLSLTNHAVAADRVLSCKSSSHNDYTAELFANPSSGYWLQVKVGGSLKYSVTLSALPPEHVSMRSIDWTKLGESVSRANSLYFAKVRDRENEFYLAEVTYAPPAFDERTIYFRCLRR